ncbi:MAG: Verru_Chthon cassette protein A, partial [Verrucomicrobiales bacterium]
RFSVPNIPSAVMFGSLPTGARDFVPWRTLLFRPDINKGEPEAHYGSMDPPDHLWLDYFWMPVVEPYAISEPFATAGKINMNYRIYPFSHIRRATGLHAVLKSERVIAVPDADVIKYKTQGSVKTYRYPIDEKATLEQFEDRFDEHKIFKSASEICELFLVPKVPGETDYEIGDMEGFWDRHKLTGDNLKERPYASLYPRLTTRSNTFKVFYTIETLRKVRGTDPAKWVEGTDLVTGRMRGSALIERLIDPNDPDLPDYATEKDPKPLDYFYRYRLSNLRQFNP